MHLEWSVDPPTGRARDLCHKQATTEYADMAVLSDKVCLYSHVLRGFGFGAHFRLVGPNGTIGPRRMEGHGFTREMG